MSEVEKEIKELSADFDKARVTRFWQSDVDSEIVIVDYYIGNDLWITMFEIYSGEEYTRVNIAGRTLGELVRIIGESK
jgi:hypothetical protein